MRAYGADVTHLTTQRAQGLHQDLTIKSQLHLVHVGDDLSDPTTGELLT